jgi:hypothetical protein
LAIPEGQLVATLIGVEKHLGVNVFTSVVRLRSQDQGSDQLALWNGQPLAQPFGIFGAAFLVVGSPAIVDHVMQPGSQLDGVQVSSMGTEAFDRIKHGSDVIERVVEAAWFGMMPGNILERLVDQGRDNHPCMEKFIPFLEHYVVHG